MDTRLKFNVIEIFLKRSGRHLIISQVRSILVMCPLGMTAYTRRLFGLAVDYFRKNLHLRCLIGFWIGLYLLSVKCIYQWKLRLQIYRKWFNNIMRKPFLTKIIFVLMVTGSNFAWLYFYSLLYFVKHGKWYVCKFVCTLNWVVYIYFHGSLRYFIDIIVQSL